MVSDLARRPLAIALAVSAIFAATACTTGFVYNRLDRVVSWYVNGMVSLDEAQDRQLHDSVRRTLEWHRHSELPRYIRMLEEMAEESAAPISATRLEQRYRQVAGFMDTFIVHANPEVASLLRTLDADQLDELEQSLREDAEDLWDDFGGETPELRRKRRSKTTVKAIQRFTGRLTSEQRTLVASRTSGMHDVTEEWLERRGNWQQRFLALLRVPPPGTALDAALLDLALRPDQFDTPEYRVAVEANRLIVMGMLADLSSTLTLKQREHLIRKFAGYAEDLRELERAR
jgi:hypothetical protein